MKIQVPATTANLGPGFDALGLALGLFNVLDLEEASDFNLDPDHLVLKAYKKAFEACGKAPLKAHFSYKGDIPMSRGLGSSAACIVAGLYGANELGGLDLSKEDLLYLGTEIEGHPDNVAPAIFGGLVASLMEEDQVLTKRVQVSDKIHFTLCIPEERLETEKARTLLPEEVSLKDAIFNLSRIPFVLEGLEKGDLNILKTACQDRLHEPYRKGHIPYFKDLEDLVGKEGKVLISGAGSTSLVLSTQSLKEKLTQALSGEPLEICELKPCHEGVKRV